MALGSSSVHVLSGRCETSWHFCYNVESKTSTLQLRKMFPLSLSLPSIFVFVFRIFSGEEGRGRGKILVRNNVGKVGASATYVGLSSKSFEIVGVRGGGNDQGKMMGVQGKVIKCMGESQVH